MDYFPTFTWSDLNSTCTESIGSLILNNLESGLVGSLQAHLVFLILALYSMDKPFFDPIPLYTGWNKFDLGH